MSTFLSYFRLISPHKIALIPVGVVAGYLLATPRHNLEHLLHLIVGVMIVGAGACAINNYLDRHIDRRVKRTKNRPVADSRIPERNALFLGAGLLFFGAYYSVVTLPFYAVLAILLAAVVYLGVYTVWKRTYAFGTIVGGIPVALMPIAGYSVARPIFDGAFFSFSFVILFCCCTQYYIVTLRRQAEYKRAGLPLVKKYILPERYHLLLLWSMSAVLFIYIALLHQV